MRWKKVMTLLFPFLFLPLSFAQTPEKSFLHLVVFRDGDVREVALTIARAANLNLLVDGSVTGSVTMHLRGVTAQQALELLAQAVGARLLKTEAGFLLTKQTPSSTLRVEVRDGASFVAATNAEAAEALRQIAEKGKVNLVLSADLPATRVTVSLQGVKVEEALKVVTEAAGWEITKEGSVFAVHRPAPAVPALPPRSPVQQSAGPPSPSPPSSPPPTGVAEKPLAEEGKAPFRSEVTLIAKDMPLSEVLDEIARQTGINLLVVGRMDERITVRLEKVPVEEALRLVLMGTKYSVIHLNPKGAGLEGKEGNPSSKRGEERPRFLIGEWGDPTKWASPSLAPFLETRRIPLRFLKADQAPQILSPAIPTGVVKVLADQNALVVTGPKELVEQVEREIRKADQKAAQVVIEAQVLEVSERALRQLTLALTGQRGMVKGEVGTTSSPGLLFVLQEGANLPSQFTLLLQALVEKGEAKTLARPKIAAVSGKKAQIQVVQELYFRTAPFFGPTPPQPTPIVPFFQLQAVSAGVKLEVTPLIGSEGDILLEISPEVSSVVGVTPEGLPQVATRKATATVWVREGQTVVLGGLKQREETRVTTQVPLLSSLPLLGEIFKSHRKEVRESELIILLTPQLLPPSTPQG